ncbi:MAG: M28 family peptidase [Candidatus Poribacteria bacterium]|nr:M28 family peptidase [Candidatus Poribacteria bacterium]
MNHEHQYLQLDRQMVGDIYTSREAMDNLIILCDDFGSRFAGTPEERRAAGFIQETFERYGLKNVRLESYSYAGWSRGEATLDIVEPVQKSIPCISLPYCPADDITADLISAGCGSPVEFEGIGGQMAGTIVLALSSSPPDLGRWVHRKEKYDRAILGGAVVFIFVSEHPGVGPETGSLQNDSIAPIPGISICKEDGAFLFRLAERYGNVRLHVRTTDINEARTSWNVIGDLPGIERPDEMVIVGCHYDGHDISQGAHDPASGMVSVIEASRVLSRYAAKRLKRTVRFIAFGTEEIGLTGAFRYVAAHTDELDNIRFMFNMDASGGTGRKGIGLHQWKELEPFFKKAAKDMAAEIPVGQKLNSYSDHFPFVLQGVPSADMSDPEAPPHGRGFGHTAYDTLEKVELENLRQASTVGARLLLRIANADEFPAQRRTNAEVQEVIDTDPGLEGYRVSLELAKLRQVSS